MIEVIVVLAIVSVLAAIVVPLATVFEDRAREEATREEMQGIERALVAWYEDHGAFPDHLDSLAVRGYLDADFDTDAHTTDAWHETYDYSPAGMTADLVSAGVDRTPSTGDDLALTVTGTRHARRETRDEMETIHVALRHYESQRIPHGLSPLPDHWPDQGMTDGAFTILVDEGLLPDEARFLSDSWGTTYEYSGSPADYVTSPHLGASP
jgi:type II secretory pathway pseudopilin PulG